MSVKIALAGNPNCGKTTMFNDLTGSNQRVGNWPGVTVEKKQAPWKKERDVELVDLPGIYSLSPYSPEEVVSRDFLVNDRPDAVVDLIDVTNLERNLYLTTQVLEAGRPVVVGLNMCDLLKERGDAIDAKKLSSMLGVPVVEVSALRNRNLDKLMQQAVDAARDGVATKGVRCFSSEVESALQKVQAIVGDAAPADLARWYAIKVFERDADAIEPLALSKAQLDAAEEVIAAVEKSRDDDAESIVTGERYDWIATVMDACVKKAPKRLTTSQKIDRVVTNRVLGLPIFAAVMIAVYWVALVAVGTPATDWVNDNLFSDGFFANSASQQKYDADTAAYEDGHYADKIDGFLAAADEKGIDTSAASKALAADTRSAADERAIKAFEAEVAGVVARDVPQHDGGEVVTKLDANGNAVLSSGQKLDVIKTVTLADFKRAVNAQEPDPHDYAGFVDSVPSAVTGWLQGAGASDARGRRRHRRRGLRARLHPADLRAVRAAVLPGGLRLHEPCRLRHGPRLQALRTLREVPHPPHRRYRMRSPRDHGLPHHREREGPQDHRHDGHVHPLRSQAARHRHAHLRRLRRQRTHRGPVLHRRSRLRPDLRNHPEEVQVPLRSRNPVHHGAAPLSHPLRRQHRQGDPGQGMGLRQEGGNHHPARIRADLAPVPLRYGTQLPDRGGHGRLHTGRHRKRPPLDLRPAGMERERRSPSVPSPDSSPRRTSSEPWRSSSGTRRPSEAC